MSDDKKIKSLLKKAQTMIHSSPGGSVAQKMAKRRSIILRRAQKDNEKGRNHEIEFGEGYKDDSTPINKLKTESFRGKIKGAYDYAKNATNKFDNKLNAITKPFEDRVTAKFNDPATTKLGKLAQRAFGAGPQEESYLGRMTSMGNKMGKMMRRLNKGK
jgi:hypothetical protein